MAEGGSQQDQPKSDAAQSMDGPKNNFQGLNKNEVHNRSAVQARKTRMAAPMSPDDEADDIAPPEPPRLTQAHSVGPVIGEFSFLRKPDLEKFDLKKKPLFIGVTGGTASGKTSICEM